MTSIRKRPIKQGQDASVATMVIAELANNPNKLNEVAKAVKDGSWDSSFLLDEVREKEIDFKIETESEIDRRIAEDEKVKNRDIEAEKLKEEEKENQISKLKKDLLGNDAKSFINGYMAVLIGEKTTAAADEETNQVALAVQAKLIKMLVAKNQANLKDLSTDDIRLKYRDLTVEQRIVQMEMAHGNQYYAQLAEILKEESTRKNNRSPTSLNQRSIEDIELELSDNGQFSVNKMRQKKSRSTLGQIKQSDALRQLTMTQMKTQKGNPKPLISLQQKLLGNHDPINSRVDVKKRLDISTINQQMLDSPSKCMSQLGLGPPDSTNMSKNTLGRNSNLQFGASFHTQDGQHTLLNKLKQTSTPQQTLPLGFTESFGAMPPETKHFEHPLNERLDSMKNRLYDLMFNTGFTRQAQTTIGDSPALSQSPSKLAQKLNMEDLQHQEKVHQMHKQIYQDLSENRNDTPLVYQPATGLSQTYHAISQRQHPVGGVSLIQPSSPQLSKPEFIDKESPLALGFDLDSKSDLAHMRQLPMTNLNSLNRDLMIDQNLSEVHQKTVLKTIDAPMRLKGVTQKELPGTKSYGNPHLNAFGSSKKQLGPVFSQKSLEFEKMTIQSKTKEINEQILQESESAPGTQDHHTIISPPDSREMPASQRAPAIKTNQPNSPMRIRDDQQSFEKPEVVKSEIHAPQQLVQNEEKEYGYVQNEKLNHSIALLEQRLQQRSPNASQTSQNKSIFQGYISSHNPNYKPQTYKKYDEFVKNDQVFGQQQNKSKLTFKSSHISHVQALINKRDSYVKRLQEFDCPSITTDRKSPAIKEQYKKMRESVESSENKFAPLKPHMTFNLTTSLESATFNSNKSPINQITSEWQVLQPTEARPQQIQSQMGSMPHFIYLSPQNAQTTTGFGQNMLKTQNNSQSPKNRLYEAHAIVLGKTKQNNSFKLDHNQKISKELLLNKVSHQRFKDYLRRLKLVEQTGDLQRAFKFGRTVKPNQTHQGRFMPDKSDNKNCLKIDIVAHSKSKIRKDRRTKSKVNNDQQQTEGSKLVAGIALYQQQKLNKDSAGDLLSLAAPKDSEDTGKSLIHHIKQPKAPAQNQEMLIQDSSHHQKEQEKSHDVVVEEVPQDADTPKETIPTKETAPPKVTLPEPTKQMIKPIKEITEPIKEITEPPTSNKKEKTIDLIMRNKKGSSQQGDTDGSVGTDQMHQYNDAFDTINGSTLMNIKIQESSPSPTSPASTKMDNYQHTLKLKQSILKKGNAHFDSSRELSENKSRTLFGKASKKTVKADDMNKDLHGLDQGAQERKSEMTESKGISQTPIRGRGSGKISHQGSPSPGQGNAVYQSIFMVDHGDRMGLNLKGHNNSSKLEQPQRPGQPEQQQRQSQIEQQQRQSQLENSGLRPKVIKLSAVDHRKQASSLNTHNSPQPCLENAGIDSEKLTKKQEEEQMQAARGASNVIVRPINVPHVPIIGTPSKLNKSLTQDLMDDNTNKEGEQNKLKKITQKISQYQSNVLGPSNQSKNITSGYSPRSPAFQNDSAMQQRYGSNDQKYVSSSFSQIPDKVQGFPNRSGSQLLGTDDTPRDGFKISTLQTIKTSEKMIQKNSHSNVGNQIGKSKGSRGTTPMSVEGFDMPYQQHQHMLSATHFIKQFNKPSVQIQSILKDPTPITYEQSDNVAYFGNMPKSRDKPYVFLPQFSTDNPRAKIEQKKKGDVLMQNTIMTKYGITPTNQRQLFAEKSGPMNSYQSSVEKCLTAEQSDSKNDISIKDTNILDKTKIDILVEYSQSRSKQDLNQYDVISESQGEAEKNERDIGIHTAFPVLMPPKRSKKSNMQVQKQKVYQTLNGTQGNPKSILLSQHSPGSELTFANGLAAQDKPSVTKSKDKNSISKSPPRAAMANKDLPTTLKLRKPKVTLPKFDRFPPVSPMGSIGTGDSIAGAINLDNLNTLPLPSSSVPTSVAMSYSPSHHIPYAAAMSGAIFVQKFSGEGAHKGSPVPAPASKQHFLHGDIHIIRSNRRNQVKEGSEETRQADAIKSGDLLENTFEKDELEEYAYNKDLVKDNINVAIQDILDMGEQKISPTQQRPEEVEECEEEAEEEAIDVTERKEKSVEKGNELVGRRLTQPLEQGADDDNTPVAELPIPLDQQTIPSSIETSNFPRGASRLQSGTEVNTPKNANEKPNRPTIDVIHQTLNTIDTQLPATTEPTDQRSSNEMGHSRKYKSNDPRMIYTNAKREKEEQRLQEKRLMVQQQKKRAQQNIIMRQSAGSGQIQKQMQQNASPRLSRQIYFNCQEYR